MKVLRSFETSATTHPAAVLLTPEHSILKGPSLHIRRYINAVVAYVILICLCAYLFTTLPTYLVCNALSAGKRVITILEIESVNIC